MMNRRSLAASVMLVATVASVGCSTQDETTRASDSEVTTSANPSKPTLTASKLQPPPLSNKYTDAEGRSPVVFDACTWISDDDVRRAGFEPSSRKRGHDVVAEQTFLSCDFDSEDGQRLAIESSNVSLPEVSTKYAGKSEPLTINGRNALLTRKTNDTCSVDIQTKAGYFGITLGRKNNTVDSCDNIVNVATVLEPSVGKDN